MKSRTGVQTQLCLPLASGLTTMAWAKAPAQNVDFTRCPHPRPNPVPPKGI